MKSIEELGALSCLLFLGQALILAILVQSQAQAQAKAEASDPIVSIGTVQLRGQEAGEVAEVRCCRVAKEGPRRQACDVFMENQKRLER